MIRLVLLSVVLLLVAFAPRSREVGGVRVASKKFTESVILGEALTQLIRADGADAMHLSELGGTRLIFDALRRGEIDAYPEYTGTLRQEIYAGRDAPTFADLRQLLRDDGVEISASLGFSNNYELATRPEIAERLGLETISDLARHPELRLGFSNEFMDRADGWRNLRKHYALPHEQVTGVDHDVAYRQLEAGTIDVMDVYSTDAKIEELDLAVLEDDRGYFPEYEAVVLTHAGVTEQYPAVAEAIGQLEGSVSTDAIRQLNGMVESGEGREAQAAAKFLGDELSVEVEVDDVSVAARIWRRTLEHVDLVRSSLIPAIFVAVPLGIVAAKMPRLGQVILGVVGIVQTIPALALLVLLIAPMAYLNLSTLGAGSATAVAALFLYSLLPIVRNTATGISSIPPESHESATALGLSSAFRLWHIELPLASRSILAGIKTAAVLNVGFATLGALVGARGYGQPILSGIRLNDVGLIMQGAIPAAALALLLQLLFELAERWFVPAGLRPGAPETSHE